MPQRTGSGPITRKVLIVDSGLAGTGAAARRVRALADELGTRNIAVTEAISYDDGLATVVSDSSIHCILLNWTQGGTDAQRRRRGDRAAAHRAQAQRQDPDLPDGQPRALGNAQRRSDDAGR